MTQLQTNQQPGVPVAQPPDQTEARIQTFENSAGKGARWFYWIAGLSAVNLAMMLSGSSTFFVIGLGIPVVAGEILKQAGLQIAAVVVYVVVLGIFALFGYFAAKRQLWAFIVGMILYVLDGLVFILAKDWMSAGFHAFVLFCLFVGVRALWQARALRMVVRQTAMPVPPAQNNQGQWQ